MTVMKLKSIEFAEKHFDCFVGPPKAYFEFGGKRVVYVVYAAAQGLLTSDSCSDVKLDNWLLSNVLKPLYDNGAKYLFWRNSDKIEISYEDGYTHNLHGRSKIWTRFAALDKDMHVVTIEDMIKPEGEKCKELDYDSDSTEDEVDE